VPTLLAVAALSARMLAEAARDGGYRPVALDLFGDADTRRVATAWRPIGAAAQVAIDGEVLLTALRELRGQGAVGWIAGSGFEGQPELLAAGAQLLPLVGNAPAVVARVRDPRGFYGRLAALGIPHPETRATCPPSPLGWLCKDAASSGGWGVWPAGLDGGRAARHGAWPARADALAGADGRAYGEGAEEGVRASGRYYQRITPGTPMSALFLANGRRSRLLGINRQIVRRLGGRPYVFRGCVGPLPVAPGLWRALEETVDALTANFGLRGLNGLDFLLDDARFAVLELNPRPPASIALYRDALPGGLVRAHLAASLDGWLPAARTPDAASAAVADMSRGLALRHGFEVVFARRPCRVSGNAAAALASRAWCHDLPAPGTRLAWGEPICTVSATGGSLAEVQAQLLRRRRQIPSLLEQSDEGSSEGVSHGLAARELECQ